MSESFINALIGGALIGLASSILLLALGRVCGISGILGSLLPANNSGAQDTPWRGFFLAGLTLGGIGLMLTMPETIVAPAGRSVLSLVIAGLLVGYGTRLGSGCTSGHGVCGLSRLSTRSLVATLTFMAFGAATATAMGLFSGTLS
jgi:uncharacterized membrane protein YedE/YeeE